MNSVVFTNVLRFFLLLAFQVLVFQNLTWSGEGLGAMFHIILYPLFIFLLPHDTKHWLLIVLGFLMGFSVDVFYNTLGVNASASVLTASLRPIVLKWQAPKGGYPAGQSPTRYCMGAAAYFQYVATLLFIHIFWYYCMDAFTVAYIVGILKRTLVSYPVSLLLVILHGAALNPKS